MSEENVEYCIGIDDEDRHMENIEILYFVFVFNPFFFFFFV